MQESRAILVSLSANMAPDVKTFIGTILISELLQAVRRRPENARNTFGVYVDEFQLFATEDYADLITQGPKFGVATTIAHQERQGQLERNAKVLGATSAAGNKVLFQLSPADAHELAAEFASLSTEQDQPDRAVISPHPVEQIWERGHENEQVMQVRSRYFWLVDLLRTKPNESIYYFNAGRMKPSPSNTGSLENTKYHDCYQYASTPDMVRQGISLINQYLYNAMRNGFSPDSCSEEEVEVLLRIVHCLGGVLGLRPTLERYIAPEMRSLLVQRLNEQNQSAIRNYQYQWDNMGGKEAWAKQVYVGPWIVREDPHGQMMGSIKNKHPEWLKEWTLADIPIDAHPLYWENEAKHVGFSQSELDRFIQWDRRSVTSEEREHLVNLVRNSISVNPDNQTEVTREYAKIMAFMALEPMFAVYGHSLARMSDEEKGPFYTVLLGWNLWHAYELAYFIVNGLRGVALALSNHPVTLPSPDYEETRRRDKTQAELFAEREAELSRLPRGIAYAKVVGGVAESVFLGKVETVGPPSEKRDLVSERERARRITQETGYTTKRTLIEEQLLARRSEWRKTRQPERASAGSRNEEAERPEEPPPTAWDR